MTTETESVADVVAWMLSDASAGEDFFPSEIRTFAKRIEAAHAREVGELQAKYNELLLSVGNKYPGESRHETALRYIKQAETTDSPDAAMSTPTREVIR